MSARRFDSSDAVATLGLVLLTIGLVRLSITLTLVVWGLGLLGAAVVMYRQREGTKRTSTDEGAAE